MSNQQTPNAKPWACSQCGNRFRDDQIKNPVEARGVPMVDCSSCGIMQYANRVPDYANRVPDSRPAPDPIRALNAADPAGLMGTVLRDVAVERFQQEIAKANGKFSKTCADPMSNYERLTVLGEEFGEVARAILEGDPENLRTVLIQVAAVSVAWVEGLDS